MKTTFRWILVLPAAIGAFVGIQLVIIILNAISDFFWGMNSTHWVQLINSGASGWAFVAAGAKTAPSNRGLAAAILAVLIVFSAIVLTFFSYMAGGDLWGTVWMVICGVVTVIASGVTFFEIHKEEKEQREWDEKERKRILENN